MKTILVMSFTNLASDPRVNRQIRWLAGRYRVIAVGTADPQVGGVEFIPCHLSYNPMLRKVLNVARLILRRFEAYYWSAAHVGEILERLRDLRVDAVVANDIESLPLALRVARGAKVIFDAHEYAPGEFEDRLGWRLLIKPYRHYLCRTYLGRAAAMITVAQGIAEEYQRVFGVSPMVVTNTPEGTPLAPQAVAVDRIRMIHHGVASPSRKLENMIHMMEHLDARFELDFMLVPTLPSYIAHLQKLASGNPRIRFIPPVPMREIVPAIASYDIGLFLLEPTNFNYRMALPNKLFEFLQAGLAVAIGPSPEMARIVDGYGLGVVAPDFAPESLASLLRQLDAPRIEALKARAHAAAHELSAEKNRETFRQLVQQVVG